MRSTELYELEIQSLKNKNQEQVHDINVLMITVIPCVFFLGLILGYFAR